MANISANISSYRFITGTWYQSPDAETWYKTTIIGHGYDASTDSGLLTTNYSVQWAYGFGPFELPSDATIIGLRCVASANAAWNNSYNGQFTGTLYNGDTAISDAVIYSSYPNGVTADYKLLTLNATVLPSVADINAGNIELRNSCSQAYCGKLFGATLYIDYLGHNGIFNLILPRG